LFFKHGSACAMVALGLLSCPAGAQTAAPAAPVAAPATARPTLELITRMRDGTTLASNVYLPEGAGPWPVALQRTPYLKDAAMYGQDNPAKWTGAGYAFVVQDVRGRGRSSGSYQPFINDVEDGYDTIEALAAQPWSNGRIGMYGGSALGAITYLAAVAAPPHLKAAFVSVAPNDYARTFYSIGGVPNGSDLAWWMKSMGLSDRTIKDAQAGATSSAFVERNGPGDLIKYVSIPIWHSGGWYDAFNSGIVENFVRLQNHGAKGARGNQRLTMGAYAHGALVGDLEYASAANPRAQGAGIKPDDVRWFDHWLKGIDNGVMDEPPVEYFMMAGARKGAPSAANRWHVAANWPLAHRESRWFLSSDMSLSTTLPTAARAQVSYLFDPNKPAPTKGGANLFLDRGPVDQRSIGKRGDYLRFQTPVLDHDVQIAGPVSVELFAATNGPDTDFIATLVDVYPDGYEALLLSAPIRARYRDGRMPDQVQMMTPNALERMVIDLWNTAQTFEKGHRIAVHITSSSSPRFEVNQNNGATPGTTGTPRIARNTIFMDKDHPSAVVLPLVYAEK
jgi:predicted acyl esterase